MKRNRGDLGALLQALEFERQLCNGLLTRAVRVLVARLAEAEHASRSIGMDSHIHVARVQLRLVQRLQ